jgi:hypothetical protein
MYLTRPLPVTLESREISITDLKVVSRQLAQKYRRGLVFAMPHKDLLPCENRPNRNGLTRGTTNPKSGANQFTKKESAKKKGLAETLFTLEQKSKPLVSVATVSELIRSNAWRVPSFRVIATDPLFESAVKRGLEARVSVILNDADSTLFQLSDKQLSNKPQSPQSRKPAPRARKTAGRA